MKKLLAAALSVALVASVPAYGQSIVSGGKSNQVNSLNTFELASVSKPDPKTKKRKDDDKKPKPPKCNKPTKKNPSPTNPCKKSSLEQGDVIVTVGLDRKIFVG
jgi:hypothetical protein